MLVNGTEGIGTGWSTNIPCYNPRDLVKSIRKRLEGEEFCDLHPWYKGYLGDITTNPKGGYFVTGKYDLLENNELAITELPLKKWTREFKNFLDTMILSDEIIDMRENHG